MALPVFQVSFWYEVKLRRVAFPAGDVGLRVLAHRPRSDSAEVGLVTTEAKGRLFPRFDPAEVSLANDVISAPRFDVLAARTVARFAPVALLAVKVGFFMLRSRKERGFIRVTFAASGRPHVRGALDLFQKLALRLARSAPLPKIGISNCYWL
jgi:hypothetical protein